MFGATEAAVRERGAVLDQLDAVGYLTWSVTYRIRSKQHIDIFKGSGTSAKLEQQDRGLFHFFPCNATGLLFKICQSWRDDCPSPSPPPPFRGYWVFSLAKDQPVIVDHLAVIQRVTSCQSHSGLPQYRLVCSRGGATTFHQWGQDFLFIYIVHCVLAEVQWGQ